MNLPLSRSAGPPIRLAAALALALLLVGWGGEGCGLGELRAMPPALVGKWTTTYPHYEGRTLEIRPRRVVLGDLGHPIDRYRIEGIRTWTAREGVVYEVRCVTDEGIQDALRFTLAEGPPPYLTVGQAPAHWTRARTRSRSGTGTHAR